MANIRENSPAMCCSNCRSNAQSGQAVDIGLRDYLNCCAVCHGESGKGDGPLAAQLKTTVSDLTEIQKNNGGVFPFDRLYRVIGTAGKRSRLTAA